MFKLYPMLTRLLFIFIFVNMALIVKDKLDLCHKYLDDMKTFSQTNLCMDKYSQVNIVKAAETLEELDVKLMCLLAGFLLICIIAIIEIVYLIWLSRSKKPVLRGASSYQSNE